MDYSEQTPRRVFESGAILLYLADKFGAFLPKDRGKRTEALNWLFWQMGSTPYVGGGFGHFYAYAPVKIKYAIDRFTMELKRQLDVLDRQLADNHFIAGDLPGGLFASYCNRCAANRSCTQCDPFASESPWN
jgi:GSH-dependent disulfide-bond oxidoreductase